MKNKMKALLCGLMATTMLLSACTTTGGSNTVTSTAPATSQTASTADGGNVTTSDNGQKILHLLDGSEPGYLNPSLASGTHDSYPLNHMFEGLYEKNPDGGEPILAAASEVSVSEDQLTWTFTIDPNAKWSNGDPLTAQDFITSFQYTLNPANAAKYSTYLYVIQGAEEINAGTADPSTLGAVVTEDGKLQITLITPLSYFPDYITHYTFYPQHTATVEQYPDWYKTPEHYVTNGAFYLTEWKNKESLTVSKNIYFRRAADVKLDAIKFYISDDVTTTWQMFEEGSLDAVYPIPAAMIEKLRTENNPVLHTFPELSTYFYYLNTKVPGLSNTKVRQALAMSIDRQVIVDNVTKGLQIPAYGVTPPGIPDGTGDYQQELGDLFTANNEEAKALLEEGLAEEGIALADFKPTILYNTDDNHKKIAETIQNMWKQNLGIDVKLENAEFQVVLDRRKAGDFEISRAGWVGDYSDPVTFLELFTSWSNYNDGQWINPEYDALIQAALVNQDPIARMNQLKEAETMLINDMGVLPIYFYTKNWAIKDNVTGYFAPVNNYVMFYYADIVE